MARILVHGLAATAGGGITYLHNFLRRVGELESGHDWLIYVPASFPAPDLQLPNVRIERRQTCHPFRRIYLDQVWLRRLVAREQIDLILATGNFGVIHPPVPQILLNRNALYFSVEHCRQLRRRGAISELVNILLRQQWAMASIKSSVVNVVPTESFGNELRRYMPTLGLNRLRAIPHGFDHESFAASEPVDESLRVALARKPNVPRILLVSHYNYFRNFETVLRGVARLRRRFRVPAELVLTTKLGVGVRDHRYDTTAAYRLMQELGLEKCVKMLGPVPHRQLPALYRTADLVVCPSYVESFGHTMVEAMASGRPIVASETAVNQEICGDAAVYFPCFDPITLAVRFRQVLTEPELAQKLVQVGAARSKNFCWNKHFRQVLGAIDDVLTQRPRIELEDATAAWENPFGLRRVRRA